MDLRKTLEQYTNESLNDLNKAIKGVYESNKLKTFDADRKKGFLFCVAQIEKKCNKVEKPEREVKTSIVEKSSEMEELKNQIKELNEKLAKNEEIITAASEIIANSKKEGEKDKPAL